MDRVGCSEDGPEWRINVLLFDVQSFGEHNFLAQRVPPVERYALLRGLEEDWSRGVFVAQNMKVQWAGKLDALRQFSEREGPALPHIIDCFVRLGSTSPCELGFVRNHRLAMR